MIDEVVVGATKKDLIVTITDDNGNAINITGGSAKLQGMCPQLPSVNIDYSGTLTDPANGRVTFPQLGTLVTEANLEGAGVNSATYNLRVKYTDSGGKFDYSAEFQIAWKRTPIY